MAHFCGCYFLERRPNSRYLQRKYLPQVNVKAHATILQNVSRTTLTQTFVNPNESKGIRELRYSFPLFDGVAVVRFVCRVGSRVITGEVKEKEKARTDYKEAVARGETAGLLEQLPEASDVFTTSVGNVPPGATVVVDVTYIGELKHDSEVDGVRFTIPTAISPRYGTLDLYKPNNVVPASKGFEVIVDAALDDGSFIREMRSPSHPIAVSMGTTSANPSAEPQMSRASASLSLNSAELDTDFVLQIVARETSIPKAILEVHPTFPNQRALMATLVPKFALKQQRPEIVFICDRSGSMGGGRIRTLSAALKVFLKSLPVGVKFNICSFGSNHDFLWPKSKSYDQDSLEKALRHVQNFDANYGGTEMLQPIKATLERRYKDMNLEVFLVTDGEIWNQQDLFSYLNEEVQVTKQPIRVFTLGIGNGVSHALIEGVARAGNGFSQAVGENEKLDSKVVRMLKAALSPHITDYSLEVKYSDASSDANDDFEMVERVADSLRVQLDLNADKDSTSSFKAQTQPISLFDLSADPDAEDKIKDSTGESRFAHLPSVGAPKLLQAPHQIPPLFAFSRTSVYLLMSPETVQKMPGSVVLRATSPDGPLELEIPVQVLEKEGQTIHQLAAKKAMQELEEGRGWLTEAVDDQSGKLLKQKYEGRFSDFVEREAVRLGVRYQVGGKWCSFVALQQQDRKDKESEVEHAAQRETPTNEYDWVDVDSDAVTLSQDGGLGYVHSRRMRGPCPPVCRGRGGYRGGSRNVISTISTRTETSSSASQSLSPGHHSLKRGRPSELDADLHFRQVHLRRSLELEGLARDHSDIETRELAQILPSSTLTTDLAFDAAMNTDSDEDIGEDLDECADSAPRYDDGDDMYIYPGGGAPAALQAHAYMSAQPSKSSPPLKKKSLGGFGAISGKLGFAPKIRSAFMPSGSSDGSSLRDRSSAAPAGAPPAPPSVGNAAMAPRAPAAAAMFRMKAGSGRRIGGSSEKGKSEEKARRLSNSNRSVGISKDPLVGLIDLQTFEGFWKLSAELLDITKINVKSAQDAAPGASEEVLATAIAVAFFEKKLAADKDTWELLVDKARAWLEDQLGGEERAKAIVSAVAALV